MAASINEKVIADLTVMYGDQPTFNADKVAVIVNRVVEEVVKARRYKEENYSDEQIKTDLENYKSQIYGLAEYDFAHFGAPGELTRSENSTSRTWVDRSKLFAGIIPLSHF